MLAGIKYSLGFCVGSWYAILLPKVILEKDGRIGLWTYLKPS
jgi:hypothetical protein